MVSAERDGDTADLVRVVLIGPFDRNGMSAERWCVGSICSPGELSKCDGVVVPSGVEGFVSALCLDFPEEQQERCPKRHTNCSKTLWTPVDEVLVRGQRDRRAREINCIEGIGVFRADFVTGCG